MFSFLKYTKAAADSDTLLLLRSDVLFSCCRPHSPSAGDVDCNIACCGINESTIDWLREGICSLQNRRCESISYSEASQDTFRVAFSLFSLLASLLTSNLPVHSNHLHRKIISFALGSVFW